jgi:hypothetical protein
VLRPAATGLVWRAVELASTGMAPVNEKTLTGARSLPSFCMRPLLEFLYLSDEFIEALPIIQARLLPRTFQAVKFWALIIASIGWLPLIHYA